LNRIFFDVEHVYGSPDCDETKRGELIKINTLFPSRTNDEQATRGGIVLFKLKAKRSITETFNATVQLSLSYEDRLGKKYQDKQLIYMLSKDEIYYTNSGIRKAILLVNYVTLLKQWINHERECRYNENNSEKLSHWERRSARLIVSNRFREQFKILLNYFQSEMAILHDKDLKQEVEILTKLIDYPETNEENFTNDDKDCTNDNTVSCVQQ